VDEGTVHLMAGDRGRARQAFELALAMSPDLARAHSSLAMMAGEQGQVEESLAHWRKAVAVDEREYDKLESLGALLWQRGRVGEARTYLEMFVESAPRPLYEREIERVRGRLGSRPPAG
jgi:Tfp pilus assembly protein PilF